MAKTNENAIENTTEVTTAPIRKTVTLTKNYGIGKANADLKARITEICRKALANEFGEDNVFMVREYSGSKTNTGTNSLCVNAEDLIKDGFTYDHCACINPTIKGIEDKVTRTYTILAFDKDGAKADYEAWVRENKEKEEKAKKEKEEKIAKAKAEREQKAAARQREKAEQVEENE